MPVTSVTRPSTSAGRRASPWRQPATAPPTADADRAHSRRDRRAGVRRAATTARSPSWSVRSTSAPAVPRARRASRRPGGRSRCRRPTETTASRACSEAARAGPGSGCRGAASSARRRAARAAAGPARPGPPARRRRSSRIATPRDLHQQHHARLVGGDCRRRARPSASRAAATAPARVTSPTAAGRGVRRERGVRPARAAALVDLAHPAGRVERAGSSRPRRPGGRRAHRRARRRGRRGSG